VAGYRDAIATIDLETATHSDYEVALRRIDETDESTVRLLSREPVRTVRAYDERLIATLPADDPVAAIVETTVAPLIVDRMSTGGLWPGESCIHRRTGQFVEKRRCHAGQR
jgi:hypothetical protein